MDMISLRLRQFVICFFDVATLGANYDNYSPGEPLS